MANGHAAASEPAVVPPAAVARPPAPSADDGRDRGRMDARAEAGFTRMRPREDHERYGIEKSARQKGMDYFWGAVKIKGQPNPRFTEFLRAGWQIVRAADFPDLSGLRNTADPRLIELGYLKKVQDDDPIVDRDLMLLVRPNTLSDVARREEETKANRQVDDQMNRLRSSSKRAIGDKTQISRHVERGANLVPDDDDVEVEA
jgi:hypothetical protein